MTKPSYESNSHRVVNYAYIIFRKYISMTNNYEYSRYKLWKKSFNELLEVLPKSYTEDTDYEALALRLAAHDTVERHVQQKQMSEYMKAQNPDKVKTQLITICIDKELEPEKAIHIQYEVIDKLREASYKFMSSCSHRFEYFAKEGWNPHIHIMTEKSKTDGQVAQAIRRKLQNISEVYRVHVSTLNFEAHQKYINGEKSELKDEYMNQDSEFRLKHNINEIYTWSN